MLVLRSDALAEARRSTLWGLGRVSCHNHLHILSDLLGVYLAGLRVANGVSRPERRVGPGPVHGPRSPGQRLRKSGAKALFLIPHSALSVHRRRKPLPMKYSLILLASAAPALALFNCERRVSVAPRTADSPPRAQTRSLSGKTKS